MIVAPVCVGSIRSVCNDVRPPLRTAKSHSTSWMAVSTSGWGGEAVLSLTGTEAAVDFGLKACILALIIYRLWNRNKTGLRLCRRHDGTATATPICTVRHWVRRFAHLLGGCVVRAAKRGIRRKCKSEETRV
jgi:hypothetical protein